MLRAIWAELRAELDLYREPQVWVTASVGLAAWLAVLVWWATPADAALTPTGSARPAMVGEQPTELAWLCVRCIGNKCTPC